jgi:hypothetical protein
MNKLQKYIPLLFFIFTAIVLAARIYLARNNLLEGWDESIYAQLGVEFVKNPDFVSYYNSQVWLEKPFLIGLITGIIQIIAPYNKLFLQGFFGFISILNLVLVWQISKQILIATRKQVKHNFDPNILALLAPIFIINTYLFFERSTTINTDTVLVFGLLGYYFYRDKFWQKLVFLCIAVWTKSLLGFLPLILELVLDYKNIFNPSKVKQYLLLFLVPSLWYIACTIRFGDEFIQKHFVEQIFSRATSVLESHNGQWWYYLDYYVKTSPISFVLFSITLISTIYLIFTSKITLQQFDLNQYTSIVLSLIYLFIISASQSKLEWYLLPVIYLISPLIPILLDRTNKYLVTICLIIFTLSGFLFLANVSFFSRNSSQNIELAHLAQCIKSLPQDKIVMFEDEESIKNYDDLNAKNGSISSTFRYGGNPAFVYYSEKTQIDFVYHIDTVSLNPGKINIIPKNDTRFNQVLIDNQGRVSDKCNSQNYYVLNW